VFRALFPVQTALAAGLDEAQIGYLISFAALAGLAGSVPIGIVIDRYGRKKPLIAGLLVTAVAVYIMAVMASFGTALVAVLVFGFAEVLGMSARQVYAMDLAPAEQRGAFLGVSSGFSNIGQITGPLVIGKIADSWGFETGFVVVVVLLVVASAVIAVLGKETFQRESIEAAADPSRP
jgi:MFS family permease